MATEPVDESAFEAAFETAAACCEVLTHDQAWHFVTRGFVRVPGAFSRTFAAEVCQSAWDEMRREHGVDQHDPDTWRKPFGMRGMPGYIRTKGTGRRLNLKADARRAFAAQMDALGGADRLPDNGDRLSWDDAAIGNIGVPGGPEWQPPAAQQPGWHKDGWHFRHFLDSPEQGLLTVPVMSDILPKSGGTFFAVDSIAPVARLLAHNPAGLHPDSVQGSGYLIPGLIEQCSNFEELTAEAGDVVLVHPFVLHRVSVNASRRERFIKNVAVVTAEPMRLNRGPTAVAASATSDQGYSLVELAVLHALHRFPFGFEAARPRQAFKPAPFRDESEAASERDSLRAEMAASAANGLVTPSWAADCGYDSNRAPS